MWQLDSDATNASSGSTYDGFDIGTGTTEGDDDASIVVPPSKRPGVLARVPPAARSPTRSPPT